ITAPGGTMTMEFHHVLHLVSETQFDTICHPHCSYLSLTALTAAFDRVGLVAVDASEVPVHGGSVRVWAMRSGHAVNGVGWGTAAVLDRERAHGLDSLGEYTGFAERVEAIRRELRGFLEHARGEGRSVVGYGAPVKGNTLLNSAGVTGELLPYTVDI